MLEAEKQQRDELKNTVRIVSNIIDLLSEGLFAGRASQYLVESAQFLHSFRASVTKQSNVIEASINAQEKAAAPKKKGSPNAKKTKKSR